MGDSHDDLVYRACLMQVETHSRANAKRTMDSHNAWKRMKPQPPDGTEKVQRIGSTDSFDCLGFGTDATNYVMLAVVHRPIGSTVRPVCKDGVWYWSNKPRTTRRSETDD